MTDTTPNVFTTGIPLEHAAPGAHRMILTAAHHLRYAALMGQRNNILDRDQEMEWADQAARDAAEQLHSITRAGSATMWLQIVRYTAELHAARLDAQDAR